MLRYLEDDSRRRRYALQANADILTDSITLWTMLVTTQSYIGTATTIRTPKQSSCRWVLRPQFVPLSRVQQ